MKWKIIIDVHNDNKKKNIEEDISNSNDKCVYYAPRRLYFEHIFIVTKSE